MGCGVCYRTRKSDKNNMEAVKPKSNIIEEKTNLDIKKPVYINKKQPKIILPTKDDIEVKNLENLNPAKPAYNSTSIGNEIINENIIKMKIKIEKNDVNNYTKILYNIEENNIPGCIINELNESNTELYINNKKYRYKTYFLPEKEGIYDIQINIKILMKSCCCLFYNIYNLQSIDLSSFNTKNVTNMGYMLAYCKNLQSIDLSSFNTQKVINMDSMFYNCNNLQSIDLSSFNTQNVTNISSMFYNCNNLQSIDLSSFNTQNVTDMCCMFSCCDNLQSIDLSSFNTQTVTNMCGMFYNCTNLQNIDLSSFNTQNVTDIKDMFSGCNKLSSAFLIKKHQI